DRPLGQDRQYELLQGLRRLAGKLNAPRKPLHMRSLVCLAVALLLWPVPPVPAQSPNTGAVVVIVADQTGASVRDARVTITNTATAAVREAQSAADGAVSFSALPLTGQSTVAVTKAGFVADH